MYAHQVIEDIKKTSNAVQDLEKFPWPLPDKCANLLISTHVLEHINPHGGVFLKFMDEAWRLLKPGGRFVIVVPYAGSPGFWQDPTHCNGITEATWGYFDPEDMSNFYSIYKPKPWKIINSAWSPMGNLETVLEKQNEKKV